MREPLVEKTFQILQFCQKTSYAFVNIIPVNKKAFTKKTFTKNCSLTNAAICFRSICSSPNKSLWLSHILQVHFCASLRVETVFICHMPACEQTGNPLNNHRRCLAAQRTACLRTRQGVYTRQWGFLGRTYQKSYFLPSNISRPKKGTLRSGAYPSKVPGRRKRCSKEKSWNFEF